MLFLLLLPCRSTGFDTVNEEEPEDGVEGSPEVMDPEDDDNTEDEDEDGEQDGEEDDERLNEGGGGGSPPSSSGPGFLGLLEVIFCLGRLLPTL